MSLTVHTFLPSPADSRDVVGQVLDTPERISNSAGFESWRTEVWGSEAMRSLGARFFPVLADPSRPRADLIVMPEEIPALLGECRMVREWLVEVVPQDPDEAVFARLALGILDRLANIEIAAGRALGVGGGVLIW
ncbi:hypothetical protein AB0N05_11295 [Nocardia sp. NPDC051030]|uniref:hypothetical protein n=1 Tax=Nocardia sp. NPDC051030 TaxID=3155162 RepID=UPI003419BB63